MAIRDQPGSSARAPPARRSVTMEKPSKTCPVGDACVPVQGAEAPPFVEGDQALLVLNKDKPAALDMNEPGCPNRKLTEMLPDDKMVEYRGDDEISPLYRRSPALQDRSPVDEEVGDKARLPVSVARPGHELSLDPTIIRFISSDAALDEGYMEGGEAHSQNPQAEKQISVLLEATQNITLRYQVVGTMGNTTGNTLEDKSESRVSNITQPRQMRETAADFVSKSPRALSSSDEMLYFKEKGELTKSSTYDEHYLPRNSRERPSSGIKDMPLLEVLEKSEFPVSSTEKAKRRVKRYYRREEDFFSGSPSLSSTESLVQLDLSNIPTETSELVGYHCQRQEASGGSGADNVEESLTSWYSFDSEHRGSRRSEVALCDTKGSESRALEVGSGHGLFADDLELDLPRSASAAAGSGQQAARDTSQYI
ncbi:hypothetical protein HPB47_019349, partial [Ixodes persulcatus]